MIPFLVWWYRVLNQNSRCFTCILKSWNAFNMRVSHTPLSLPPSTQIFTFLLLSPFRSKSTKKVRVLAIQWLACSRRCDHKDSAKRMNAWNRLYRKLSNDFLLVRICGKLLMGFMAINWLRNHISEEETHNLSKVSWFYLNPFTCVGYRNCNHTFYHIIHYNLNVTQQCQWFHILSLG